MPTANHEGKQQLPNRYNHNIRRDQPQGSCCLDTQVSDGDGSDRQWPNPGCGLEAEDSPVAVKRPQPQDKEHQPGDDQAML